MEIKPLVSKVQASGYAPKQKRRPIRKPASFTKNYSLSSADTKKHESRAFVSRDAMPISYEPYKSPRSKTLAQIGRSLRRV